MTVKSEESTEPISKVSLKVLESVDAVGRDLVQVSK